MLSKAHLIPYNIIWDVRYKLNNMRVIVSTLWCIPEDKVTCIRKIWCSSKTGKVGLRKWKRKRWPLYCII